MASYRFTAYDPDVCEIMEKLRHRRGMFIEVAVREFLKTKKGQDFLQVLLEKGLNKEFNKEKEEEEKKEEKKEKKGKRKVTFDEFL